MSNAERDDDILRRIRAGASIYRVAEDYGLTPQRISQIVKEQSGRGTIEARGYDLQRRYKVVDAIVVQRFRLGETVQEIADALDVGRSTIIRSLHRSGYNIDAASHDIRRPAWLVQAQAVLDGGATLADTCRIVDKTYPTLRYHVLAGNLTTDAFQERPARAYVDRDTAEQLRAQGYSWPQIARTINIPLTTLRTRAMAEGWYTTRQATEKRRRIEQALDDEPRRPAAEIARELGVSRAYVRDIVQARSRA